MAGRYIRSMQIKDEFIRRVLTEQGRAMNDASVRAIRKHITFKYGRSGRLENGNTEQVSNNRLIITHPIHKRFLDMRSKLRNGKPRKRKYPIHNKIIFGHYNEIAYKLMYGFTKDVAREIQETFKG